MLNLYALINKFTQFAVCTYQDLDMTSGLIITKRMSFFLYVAYVSVFKCYVLHYRLENLPKKRQGTVDIKKISEVPRGKTFIATLSCVH